MTDMRTLQKNVQPLFQERSCAFSKTVETFSFTPLCQAYEHNVKAMKGSGGIVSLQQGPILLRNQAIVSLEVVRIINEFVQDYTIHSRKNYDSEGAKTKSYFCKRSAVDNVCNT